MRSFRDTEGKRWDAFVVGGHGAGARGPGDKFPQATHASVTFTCEDGREVTRDLAAGQLDRATDAELVAILEEPEEDE